MFDAAGVATGVEVAEQAASTAEAETGSHDASSNGANEVYFVDSSVEDADVLTSGVPSDAEIVHLNSGEDGLQQMADYLAGRSDISAIHLLSHGGDGAVYAGSTLLTSGNASQYAGLLQIIGQSLTEDGDILLYGCNIGASDAGKDFLSDLANLTGADVAASDDVTGVDGDWNLEVSVGGIEAQVGISYAAREAYENNLATFDFSSGNTGDKTGRVSASVSGVTVTVTSSGPSGSDVEIADLTGIGALSGNAIYTSTSNYGGAGTTSLTLTFSSAVDVSALTIVTNTTAGAATTTTNLTFTPNTGSAVNVNSVDGNSASNVNFTGITSITVTSDAGQAIEFAVDNIQFTLAATDPTIDTATYDASSGSLVVTGTNFTANAGASNDVDASKLTITGEGGATYTLTDTSDVEIDSATQFTLTLSATDKAAIDQILNKAGTASTGGTTYDVDGAAGFVTTSASISDTGTNGITVSNVATPTISNATYDYSTNTLTVTGTGFVKSSGASNDIDISKLTFTGEGGATYTLTSASDVEITSGTSFSVMLSGADLVGVESLLNKDGASADSGTVYNLAAAEDWAVGADSAVNVADTTGNGITVSNYAVPVISTATYNASTNTITLTGTNFVSKSGASNDVDASLLTVTGEGGETYTLTNTSDVEVSSDTSITIVLSDTDAAAVEGLLNNNGTTSATSGTTFNIAAADNWMTGSPAGNDVADATTGVTVSGFSAPSISTATYDYSTNILTVTGANFVSNSGATNDVDVSLITITGEGGTSYTLTSASDVEITSSTTFSVTLSGADLVNVETLLNKDGTTSATSGTAFNIAVADNWMTQSPAATDIADTTGNSITVSNYAAPAVTAATFDWSNGQIVLTGTNFVASSGANNDIDASLLTFTGEGGATYTLTDTSDVDVTSATSATLTLSATDLLAIRGLLNKNGGTADDNTTYNIAAADNWATGAPSGNNIADATTGVTVSNVSAPTVTSATYDASTNVLTVTGTNFVSKSGASNDIDVSLLTFTGEGGATYTLTSASDVEITNGTTFSVTLSGADVTGVEALLNNNGGTSATSGTTYNLAVADNWLTGAAASTDIADASNTITVSNYAGPVISTATFDWSNGQLVITGTNFVSASGATNDIDASLLTITGEGGATYTLTDTSDVEITSDTSATIALSATDLLNVKGLLNKDGTASGGSTTYNLAAADNWNTGAPAGNDIADATTVITVSNYAAPTISSATYDSDTGVLTVTGTNFTKASGAANDIDVSRITLTGGTGNATYTLTTATDVEITNATTFSVTLSGADKTGVDALLDQIGSTSAGGSLYNIAVADNWMTAADTTANIADATNGVTVSINPKVTSANYDASTGQLVVTGTNIQAFGGGSDIDASKFTFTGEGGETYTLTDSSDVERDSVTQFTITLSATDKAAINQILNKNGNSSTGGTAFNLAAADDWSTAVTAGDTSDTTGNQITVSNVAAPAITSATYDVSTNQLVVTGTGFLKVSGAANDIDVSLLTITGEGGATYTLTDSSDVEITNGTTFTVTLSATDAAGVEALTQSNGTSAASGTVYNLAAGEDWAKGADATVNVADTTGNGITVSNFAFPVISTVTYDANTGQLVLTGTNFLAKSGSANDIDASLLTITGEGGATYTLTDTADVEITSATSATLTLSATDQLFVEALLNKNGATSDDNTTYNIAAADNWMTGSAASLDIADPNGGMTVSNISAPAISSAIYNSSTNILTVTGTNFVAISGANNDIDVSTLSLTGPNSASYTLTSGSDVDVTSATEFQITLNATDAAAVEAILSANEGTGSVYGISAADNWLAGAASSVNIADTGTVTVSGYAAPTTDTGTNSNVSQNSNQGRTPTTSTPTATPAPAPITVVGPSSPTSVGGVDGGTTASQIFSGTNSATGSGLGDPSAGVDAMSIVRNVVTGNNAMLNQFYGATSSVGGGGLGGGIGSSAGGSGVGQGLSGLADGGGDGLGGFGNRGGLSGLADSFLSANGPGEGTPANGSGPISFNDYSHEPSGFSAELASAAGMRETALLKALLGKV